MKDEKEKYAYMVRELRKIIRLLQEEEEKYRKLYIECVCSEDGN